MKKNRIITFFMLVATAWLLGCEEELDKAVFSQNSDDYIAPEITSSATKPEVVFTATNTENHYETLTWTPADYGVNISVKYIVQIDDDEDFTNPKVLGTTFTDSLSVTNGMLNNAILSLGYGNGDNADVNIRVLSMLNDFNVSTDGDTLKSSSIARSVKVYQDSECGNFCSIGLIGSALTGNDDGWNADIDMRLTDPTRTDKYNWTVTAYLHGGFKVKLRAADGWANNWGGSTFPSGTASAGGDDMIVSTSGYYKVSFNDQTLALSFELLAAPTYTTVGIIGSATTGSEDTGWSTDIDMTQDGSDPHIWTTTITLFAGGAKFRANDGWDTNWGTALFPSGYGTLGGSNIPATAGTYFVRFNDVTGEYAFMPTSFSTLHTDIGIIGSATTGSEDTGWSNDINLIQNPSNPYLWSMTIELFEGGGKFRANNGWDLNWGGATFPGGNATLNGSNIPVKAGTYFVTFNSGTGEYYFLK